MKIRYRCPYCGTCFAPPVRALCSHCGRAMRLPAPVLAAEGRKSSARSGFLDRRNTGSTPAWMVFLKSPRQLPIFGAMMLALAVIFVSIQPGGEWAPVKRVDPQVRAVENMGVLRIALELFRHDLGRYPDAGEGLPALLHEISATGWQGPYIVSLTCDPWRNPFHYAITGTNLTLCALGPDGILGTADDIPAPPVDWATVESVAAAPPALRVHLLKPATGKP
ncbi:MAG: type II secretion system protein GspG [bacterium]